VNGQFTIPLQIPDDLRRRRLTIGAMHLFRLSILMAGVVSSLIARAGESSTAACKATANPAVAAELRALQGTWEGVKEGVGVSQKLPEKVTITIAGNALRFHRDERFWFDTTIVLPAGTEPKQLHATIKESASPQKDSLGKVVGAIFKIEDGTFTLAEYAIAEEPPKSFADAPSRYILKKVEPPKQSTESPKLNEPRTR
jgi:uncharacterized protein (TIGR03067 family)